MKFAAKATADFEPVPSGSHLAICNGIVSLGLQPGSAQFPDPKPQVYIRFELPNERIEFERDGKKIKGPMSIGRRFTASMSKKANLRKFIEAWFSKPFPSDEAAANFDLMTLLDRKCLLNVSHTDRDGRTYANIAGASPIPKGMQADFKRENQPLLYDVDEHDDQLFAQLPEWLMNLINNRLDKPKPAVTATNGGVMPYGNRPGYQGKDSRIQTTDTGLPTGQEPGASFDDSADLDGAPF